MNDNQQRRPAGSPGAGEWTSVGHADGDVDLGAPPVRRRSYAEFKAITGDLGGAYDAGRGEGTCVEEESEDGNYFASSLTFTVEGDFEARARILLGAEDDTLPVEVEEHSEASNPWGCQTWETDEGVTIRCGTKELAFATKGDLIGDLERADRPAAVVTRADLPETMVLRRFVFADGSTWVGSTGGRDDDESVDLVGQSAPDTDVVTNLRAVDAFYAPGYRKVPGYRFRVALADLRAIVDPYGRRAPARPSGNRTDRLQLAEDGLVIEGDRQDVEAARPLIDLVKATGVTAKVRALGGDIIDVMPTGGTRFSLTDYEGREPGDLEREVRDQVRFNAAITRIVGVLPDAAQVWHARDGGFSVSLQRKSSTNYVEFSGEPGSLRPSRYSRHGDPISWASAARMLGMTGRGCAARLERAANAEHGADGGL